VSRHGDLLNDADFRRLLQRRSRLRWSLAALLTAVYFAYGLAGLYWPDVFGTRLPGSTITWSIVLGYAVIALGIACSIGYVWQVNRIIAQMGDAGEWR
jgi:uncharacterized membrane protein (DUF485 family)